MTGLPVPVVEHTLDHRPIPHDLPPGAFGTPDVHTVNKGATA